MGRELIDKEAAIIAIRTCFADSPALASIATSAIYSLPVKKSVSVYSEGYSYRDLGDSYTNSVKRQLSHYLIDDIVAAGGGCDIESKLSKKKRLPLKRSSRSGRPRRWYPIK